MAKFRCKKCKCEKNILKQTLVFKKEKFIVKEALCKCGKYMKDNMPNCKMHTFKEVGHLFPYEIPEETSKKALSFLLA